MVEARPAGPHERHQNRLVCRGERSRARRAALFTAGGRWLGRADGWAQEFGSRSPRWPRILASFPQGGRRCAARRAQRRARSVGCRSGFLARGLTGRRAPGPAVLSASLPFHRCGDCRTIGTTAGASPPARADSRAGHGTTCERTAGSSSLRGRTAPSPAAPGFRVVGQHHREDAVTIRPRRGSSMGT
jgi:hypothetical protein